MHWKQIKAASIKTCHNSFFFLEKVYLTPLTIGGCLLHPLTYKTSYSTPQTIENYLNNHLRRFWRLFCWRGILKSLHNIHGWLHNPFNYRTWYWSLKVSNNNVQMTPDGFVGPFGHRTGHIGLSTHACTQPHLLPPNPTLSHSSK